jgi:glucosamine-6-phosphate deaminase
MRVLVASSALAASRIVARIVARTLQDQPDAVLGLPTGRTMIPVYESLVRLNRRGLASFKRATTFNLDEFVGLPTSHPGTYRAFMARHLFDRVDLARAAAHFPGTDAGAGNYDEAIRRAGGLDLCLVGIGRNGHVGFNEPAGRLHARTHRVRLLAASRRANAYLFSGQMRNVPRFAMSMGIGTILQSRALVLLATGRDKALVVRSAFNGRVSTRVPASLLQAHPNVLVVLDRAAAQTWRSR